MGDFRFENLKILDFRIPLATRETSKIDPNTAALLMKAPSLPPVILPSGPDVSNTFHKNLEKLLGGHQQPWRHRMNQSSFATRVDSLRMATFLFAWELGGGLGHVLPFRPVSQTLIADGHRLVPALRDQKHATSAFGDLPIRCLPGPHKSWRTDDRIEPLLTFAHILHNTG